MKKVILTMFAVLFSITLSYAESCKDSPVKTEYKADIENCKSQKRTCCEDGTWSDWDAECEKHEGCFNGTTWEKEPDPSTEYETNELPKPMKDEFDRRDSMFPGEFKTMAFFPLKYTRTKCKCEEGKGWKCRQSYKKANFMRYYLSGSAKKAYDDVKVINTPTYQGTYSCGYNDSNDKYGFTFGTALASALGLPRQKNMTAGSYAFSSSVYYTDEVNGAAGCMYLWKAQGRNISSNGTVSDMSNASCTLIPKSGFYNGVSNGSRAYIHYTLGCFLDTYSAFSVDEK